MPHAGDGFTVVGAMRSSQPQAVTLIPSAAIPGYSACSCLRTRLAIELS